jgi:hypothetical protein
VTLDSLMVAWDRERQADRLVSQMTPAELEQIWAGDGPEQELLRRAAIRMKPFAALTAKIRRMA